MKLSFFKLYNIRTLLIAGRSVKSISKKYAVKPKTIIKIKTDYLNCPLKFINENVSRHYKMRGEKAPRAKLNEKQVIRIKKQLKAGATCRDVANMYNVTQPTIWAIKTSKTWKHL